MKEQPFFKCVKHQKKETACFPESFEDVCKTLMLLVCSWFRHRHAEDHLCAALKVPLISCA